MSTFGTLFKVTTFGESHCKGVGAIVEGVPPRMQLTEADIQPQLTRRRPGQSRLTTPRDEKDKVTILSGTEFGITLGTPVGLFVKNEDHRPRDYGEMKDVPRPSHADYTYQIKYGVRASSGGGRASARETIGRVAAGAIAEKWLREKYTTDIVSWVSQVGAVKASRELEGRPITRDDVDKHLVRCPDEDAAAAMTKVIEAARDSQDSIGGVVTCVIRHPPGGVGEPCFDKLTATLAHAMMSIPATKGFEVGSGFDGVEMRGSQHNDMFYRKEEKRSGRGDGGKHALGTVTNNSGGIQGGISNGEDIVFRIAFKAASTIGQAQSTADFQGDVGVLAAKGRHDPCVVPRAVPIVEAMAALVLADAALVQEARAAASRQYELLGKAGQGQVIAAVAAAAAEAEEKEGE